jgi:hypothetical protein
MRSTTKSAVTLAREAMAAAERALPRYSHPCSPHKFTQHQLFAILVLRQFLRMDFRGVAQTLSEWSDLREALGLNRVPHYSTLCLAEQRLLKGGHSMASLPPFSLEPALSA